MRSFLVMVLAAACGDNYAGPDAAAPDRDRDGIADEADNCPTVANADQHDEDRDLVGDACDPCPQVRNEGAGDLDGDGVPDQCDLHPDQAGDALVLFEGFGTAAAGPNGWTVLAGTAEAWHVRDDALHVTADSGGALISAPRSFTGRLAIEVAIDVDDQTYTGGDTPFVGVGLGANDTMLTYTSCDLAPATPGHADLSTHDSGRTVIATIASNPPVTPGSYLLAMATQPISACNISARASATSLVSQMSRSADLAALYATNMTATFRWIAVYEF